MDVLKSLNNILYTLLSDAEARNFNPPVPATVVAEIETLIAHFKRHEEFRILPGGTTIKPIVGYVEMFDPSIERIKWIKQFRETFRCSLKEAHDLSISRSDASEMPFDEFLLTSSTPATQKQVELFEEAIRDQESLDHVRAAAELRSNAMWGN